MGLFDSLTGGLFGGDDDEKVEIPQIPVPDPEQIIGRQLQTNRINQITPFGRLQFEGPNKNTLRFALSPALQRLLDQQAGFGSASIGRGMGLLNAIPGSGDEAVNAQLQRLQPGFDLQERRLRERLEQSGNPGAFGSQAQGPAYQGQMVNNALALGSGSPIGVPQFNFQGASPIDVMGPFGLQQQGRMANAGYGLQGGMFNAGVAGGRQSDTLGGLFDIGSAVLGGFL
jgi:hypothetical protein